MDHGVSSCLALSSPMQHPLNHLVLGVLKLTLCMVHLRLAIANRPIQAGFEPDSFEDDGTLYSVRVDAIRASGRDIGGPPARSCLVRALRRLLSQWPARPLSSFWRLKLHKRIHFIFDARVHFPDPGVSRMTPRTAGCVIEQAMGSHNKASS